MTPIQMINNYYYDSKYFNSYIPKNIASLWKTFFMFGNFTRKAMEAPQGCYYSRGTCGRMNKLDKN